MTVQREVKQSPAPQGVDEIVAYTLETVPWGGSASSPPSSPSVTVYDVTDGTFADVTSTVMPSGSASIIDVTKVLCPALKLLTEGKKYRVEILFTISGNVLEAYGIVHGER